MAASNGVGAFGAPAAMVERSGSVRTSPKTGSRGDVIADDIASLGPLCVRSIESNDLALRVLRRRLRFPRVIRTSLPISRLLRHLAFLASSVVVCLTIASPAGANVTRKKAMWGPLRVRRSLGPSHLRAARGRDFEWRLDWNKVATQRPSNPRDPRDPAYVWPTQVDQAVAEGRQYGIDVFLAVIGTPSWANGGRDPQWSPDQPADYANFMSAAAKRYPGVHFGWCGWSRRSRRTFSH